MLTKVFTHLVFQDGVIHHLVVFLEPLLMPPATHPAETFSSTSKEHRGHTHALPNPLLACALYSLGIFATTRIGVGFVSLVSFLLPSFIHHLLFWPEVFLLTIFLFVQDPSQFKLLVHFWFLPLAWPFSAHTLLLSWLVARTLSRSGQTSFPTCSHTPHTLSTSFVHCIVSGDWGMGILGMGGALDLTCCSSSIEACLL